MAATATAPATAASTPNTVPAAITAPAKNTTLPPSSNITTSDPALRSSLNSLQDSKTPEYVILQPIDEATFSSETSASVEKILVKEGSYFQAGDILLELDCRSRRRLMALSLN
jgi:multidrug efflux pump subunit AcrA (membrane-fusion protein)